MKNSSPIKRTILFLTIAVFVFCLLTYFVGFWVISTEWKREFSTEQISNWTKDIENTPKISENFKSIFSTLKPFASKNEIKIKYHDYIWKHLFGFWPKRRHSSNFYSQKVAELILKTDERIWKNLFDQSLILAFGIENFVTPSKCVDYYLNNVIVYYPINSIDTIHKITGINGIANYKFNKNIVELTEDEVLEVIVSFDFGNKRLDKFYDSALLEKRKKTLKLMLKRKKLNK